MRILLSGCWIALSAVILTGCHGGETTHKAVVESAAAQVVTSRLQQVSVGLRATGTVHAKETAILSAQVMGRIEQVLVHEGDTVRAGQTLVILDGAVFRQSLAQSEAAVLAAQNEQAAAQSNATLAASTLARYRQLQSEQSVSPQELDEVTRRAEAAQAQLEAARAQTQAARAQSGSARTILSYARLAAPFAGIVTARAADPGSMAAPGVPLLQLDRAGPLQLQVTVDESAISSVHPEMKTEVTLSGNTQTISGTVAAIVPVADSASHSVLVKIDLPPSPLARAGVYGTAQFPGGTLTTIILIPRSAVMEQGSLHCAYVLDRSGIAQLRYLALGTAYGDFIEVLSGITAGEQLVDAPEDRDLAGKRIVVQNGARP